MEKITFQGIECYIAYKALDENNRNFQRNYTYETNKWHTSYDVNTNPKKTCSYGMNMAKNIEWCVDFTNRYSMNIYKCYVPIENNKVTFITADNDFQETSCSDEKYKFRCESFYMTDILCPFEPKNNSFVNGIKLRVKNTYKTTTKPFHEFSKDELIFIIKSEYVDINKIWDQLDEYEKNSATKYQNVDIDKYWSQLTDDQKENICKYRRTNLKINLVKNVPELIATFDKLNVDKYWSELNEKQKDLVCRWQTLNVDKYWSQLTDYQKDLVCRWQTLNVDKYWSQLTDYQKDLVCANQDINVDKYWSELTYNQKSKIIIYQDLKVDKYWSELNKELKYLTLHSQMINSNSSIINIDNIKEVKINYMENKIYSNTSLNMNFNNRKVDINNLEVF